MLEALEAAGELRVAAKYKRQARVAQRSVQWTGRTLEATVIDAPLSSLMPATVDLASTPAAVSECNEWADRCHFLGYRRPFGPNVRYFNVDAVGRKLGALGFSYAPRKVKCGDVWIGWHGAPYKRHLERVVCNTRFLIFPWVKVKCLASQSLSLATGRLAADWWHRYGYRPWLV